MNRLCSASNHILPYVNTYGKTFEESRLCTHEKLQFQFPVPNDMKLSLTIGSEVYTGEYIENKESNFSSSINQDEFSVIKFDTDLTLSLDDKPAHESCNRMVGDFNVSLYGDYSRPRLAKLTILNNPSTRLPEYGDILDSCPQFDEIEFAFTMVPKGNVVQMLRETNLTKANWKVGQHHFGELPTFKTLKCVCFKLSKVTRETIEQIDEYMFHDDHELIEEVQFLVPNASAIDADFICLIRTMLCEDLKVTVITGSGVITTEITFSKVDSLSVVNIKPDGYQPLLSIEYYLNLIERLDIEVDQVILDIKLIMLSNNEGYECYMADIINRSVFHNLSIAGQFEQINRIRIYSDGYDDIFLNIVKSSAKSARF